MNETLLPIGTVVLLSGGAKKVMITGYYSSKPDVDKIYDYNGCIFPEGLIENTFCLFDKTEIAEVYYKGLENEEYHSYINEIAKNTSTSNSPSENNKNNDYENENLKNASMLKRPDKQLSQTEMKSLYGIKKSL